MITPEQVMTFKKIRGKHQLPIEPLNKAHEKNIFDISQLGINTDEWKYKLTEEDIQNIKMEGIPEQQSPSKRQRMDQ
jgi:hypothetical protein